MPNVQMAEWILSLVTDAPRASALAGDLREESIDRGAIWFWASLIGAAGSLVRGTLRTHFGKLIGRCVLAWIAEDLAVLSAWILLVEGGPKIGLRQDGAFLSWAGIAIPLFVAFFAGRWLARRSPGQEVAIAATYIAIGTALDLTLTLHGSTRPVWKVSYGIPMLLAGAISARRERVRAERPRQ